MNILADSACMHAKSLQSCPTLYDPMEPPRLLCPYSRLLEWIAMPSARGSSGPRDQTLLTAGGVQ